MLSKKIKTILQKKGLSGLLSAALKRIFATIDRIVFYDLAYLFICDWLVNPFFYSVVSSLGFREGEHQIGRLLNMKKVFRYMRHNQIDGAIVEFGTYKGFGLHWIVKYRNRYLPDAKVIGIDSFEGLPESSTVWTKGMFSDASYESLTTKINKNRMYYHDTYIIKGLFNDEDVRRKIKNLIGGIKGLALAHIDCDLGSSALDALKIIEEINNGSGRGKFFLLFDDWGNHPEEIPRAFESFVGSKGKWVTREFCSTRLTKYFLVEVARG